jgi:hypothetical protein
VQLADFICELGDWAFNFQPRGNFVDGERVDRARWYAQLLPPLNKLL